MSDAFLPQDYKVPEKSNYTKFQDGENNLRILQSPVLGWELWVNKKPLCRKMDESFTMDELNSADTNNFTGQKKTPQHFWAMVVWNYDQKCLQIWKVTQKGIMRDLKNLSVSKWGNPKEFDLSIMKSGEKMDTTYSLLPNPKTPLDKQILEAFKTAQIDVNKLFSGEDPFNSKNDGNEGLENLVNSEVVANEMPDF